MATRSKEERPTVVVRKRRRPTGGTASQSGRQAIPCSDDAVPTAPPKLTRPIASTLLVTQPQSSPQASPPPAAVRTAAPGKKRCRSQRQRQVHNAKVQQLYEVLQQRWPQTFGDDVAAIRPLAIGIDRDLVAQLSEYPRWAVKQALIRWLRTHQVRYWQALIQGGPRYDLEGQVRGEVTAEQQVHAKQQRAEWFARRRLTKGQSVGRQERPSQPLAEESE